MTATHTEEQTTEARTEPLPPLVMPVAGDRCGNCGAQLAADQRYCLECGDRRGTLSLPARNSAATATATTVRETHAHDPRRSGMPAGATLIAGVGTLLLAIGVGVLIGRSGHDNSSGKAPAAQIITVAGGAAAPAAAGAAPATASHGAAGTSHAAHATKRAAAAKAAVKHTSVAKSVAAVGKGGSVKATNGKVVTVGQKGHGPGYQNGQFTGNFFGP